MYELSIAELGLVSGAGEVGEALVVGAASTAIAGGLGGGIGTSLALSSSGATAALATSAGTVGTFIGAGLGAAFGTGYIVGTILNQTTPIQSWMSSAIGFLTPDAIPDQAGTNYSQ